MPIEIQLCYACHLLLLLLFSGTFLWWKFYLQQLIARVPFRLTTMPFMPVFLLFIKVVCFCIFFNALQRVVNSMHISTDVNLVMYICHMFSLSCYVHTLSHSSLHSLSLSLIITNPSLSCSLSLSPISLLWLSYKIHLTFFSIFSLHYILSISLTILTCYYTLYHYF